MIQAIPTKTILRIRDHLLAVGQEKPSTAAKSGDMTHPLEGDDEAKRLFDAVTEAMFLMIASDEKIEDVERNAFRGGLRELTANEMPDGLIEQFLQRFEGSLKSEGLQPRLAAVCKVLKDSEEAAEAAFVLMAALAFADDEIADEENALLNSLAGQLNISETRAGELLDQLEQDGE